MKKRIIGLLLAVAMIAGIISPVTVPVSAENTPTETVKYIDEKGVEQTAENCIVMSSTEAVTTYSFEAGEWYYVKGTFTVTNRIENHAPKDNPAHLILGDEAVLNANSGIHNSEGQGLIIYAQSVSAPGSLYSNSADNHAAGIGGNVYEAGGNLIICGGNISAIGGFLGGAGIGGGYNGDGGTVTVNGGTVTALGAEDNGGAGIGGGNDGNGGTVTVNGGKVTAEGRYLSAGIGGGFEDGNGGTVTVNGGKVVAKGNSTPGIGGGYKCTDNGKLVLGDGLDMFVGYSETNCKYQIYQLYAYTLNEYVEITKSPFYTVKHLKQNADKTGYEVAATETLQGHTGDKTTASFKFYDGFAPLVFEQKTINKDGSTVVEIYYDRISAAHEHTFAEDYIANDTHHWHAASCGHTDVVSGFGAHIYESIGAAQHRCTVCGKTEDHVFIDGICVCGEELPSYTVTFDMQGHGTAPDNQKVFDGKNVIKPANPTAEGYTFGGWYKQAECIDTWNFDTDTVNENITLYAKWTPYVEYQGDCGDQGDNVKWTLTSDGLLTIRGTGAMADYAKADSRPWGSHSNQITSVVIESGVTYIGNMAFYDCRTLTSVSIPESVTSIGRSAFTYCVNLTGIQIPDSVTSIGSKTFMYCVRLTKITLPDGITAIEEDLFYACANLEKVTIPDGVTAIGSHVFFDCPKLTDINIPTSVITIDERAFSGCESIKIITIPDGVTVISDQLFCSCYALTSVVIPESVVCIGNGAFDECDNLLNVYYGGIPEQWENIENRPAFENVTVHYAKKIVTFDLQGYGTKIAYQIVDSGEKVQKPTDPTDTGKAFVGWYTECECINEWNFDTDVVNGNMTLYAKWVAESCTVWLCLGDEEDTRTSVTASYGTKLPTITPPVREGLVFLGYFDAEVSAQSGEQYYDADGNGVRPWDKETSVALLVARWASAGADGHTHTYSENWSIDPYFHWHDSTCEHGGLTSGFGAHVFGEGVVDGNLTVYTCTECGYQKIIFNPEDDSEGEVVSGIYYTGVSLTIDSDIYVNFYMELNDTARENGTMTFDIGGRTVENAGVKSNSNGYYFPCPITALEMDETVTATFTFNGIDYVQKYSVTEYVEAVVGGGEKYTPEAKLLAKKIANYGHYIQTYLESIHKNVTLGVGGYATTNKFSDVDIDVEKAKTALANYKVAVTGESANLSLYGSTVYFDSATSLNYYLTVENGVKPSATAVNTVTGETKQVDVKLYKDKIYIVSVKDITATELADDIKVIVNEEISLTGSVLAYCNSVVKAHSGENATDIDTYAVNAMAAFYEYYAAAMEYISFELHFDTPENYKIFAADGTEITEETTVKCYRPFGFYLEPAEKYVITMVGVGGLIEPDENGLYTVSFNGGEHNVSIYVELETVRLTVNVEGENASEMYDTKISFVYDGYEVIYGETFAPGIYRIYIPKGMSGKLVITKTGYQEYSCDYTADGTVEEIGVKLLPDVSYTVSFNMMGHGSDI